MDALIAILAVAGLIWAMVFIFRGSLISGCLAFLVVNACLGYYFFNFDVGSVNMTLDRPLLILLGVAYMAQRGLGRTDPKPLGRSDAVVLTFIGWLALRTFWSDWTTAAPQQPSALWLLLSGYVSPLAVYWVARQSPLNEKAVRKIQLVFIALGIYLSVTGILEIAQQWWLVFPSHIADPTLAQHFGRARGPMVNSMSLGFFLTICLLCCWNYRDRLGFRGQLLMLGLCLLNLVGLYLTYTRVVWIGAVLSVLAVAWVALPRRVAVMGTLCVLMGAALLAATKGEELWALDTGRVASQTRDSSEMRVSFNYVAWQMYLDKPFLGWGLGQFVLNSPAYLSDRSIDSVLEHIRGAPVHNEFMSILVETGPVGLALLIATLGIWAYGGWRLWHDTSLPSWARSHGLLVLALIVAYVAHGLFHPLGHTYMVQFALYFVAGVSVGLQRACAPAPRPRHVSLPDRAVVESCISPSR